MKIFRSTRNLIFALTVAVIVAGLSGFALAQNRTATGPDPNNSGVGRGGAGFRVNVFVKQAGKPAANASIAIKSASGAPVKTGTTDATGLLATRLDEGDYTVVATTDGGTATGTAHVVKSGTPLVVRLAVGTP